MSQSCLPIVSYSSDSSASSKVLQMQCLQNYFSILILVFREKLESLYQTAVDAKAKQKDFYSSIPLITELSNRINKQCQTVHAEVGSFDNNTKCGM